MRYFIDTEFIEDGRVIDLLSIGVVDENGREYYAQNLDCKIHKAKPWVARNVVANLEPKNILTSKYREDTSWRWKTEIKEELLNFINGDPTPEFWGYMCHYDWVVILQLFGDMDALPPHFPFLCMDIEQWRRFLDAPRFPKQMDTKHHALNDARWVKDCWNGLYRYNLTKSHTQFRYDDDAASRS